jgi:hypothetical protein
MRIRFVLGCCLLMIAPTLGHADSCSDLQAAIAKAAALKGALQREAGPLLNSPQMRANDEGVCVAAKNLREQNGAVAKLIDVKCLSEEQLIVLQNSLKKSNEEADSSVGLFCH